MLLLVLILVLIAFALLVVALLSGSVLSAWLAVGVSVLAGVVLVVDWLQRRAAVRAGSDPDPVRATSAGGDIDPVTEVFAALPTASSSAAAGDGPTTATPFSTEDDGQQTMVLPVVRPSGSDSRPSGAQPGATPLGSFLSPSVTSRADESVTTDSPDSDARPSQAVRPDAEQTVVVGALRPKGTRDAADPDEAETVAGSHGATAGPSSTNGSGDDAAATGSSSADGAHAESDASERSSPVNGSMPGWVAAGATATEAGPGTEPERPDGGFVGLVKAARPDEPGQSGRTVFDETRPPNAPEKDGETIASGGAEPRSGPGSGAAAIDGSTVTNMPSVRSTGVGSGVDLAKVRTTEPASGTARNDAGLDTPASPDSPAPPASPDGDTEAGPHAESVVAQPADSAPEPAAGSSGPVSRFTEASAQSSPAMAGLSADGGSSGLGSGFVAPVEPIAETSGEAAGSSAPASEGTADPSTAASGSSSGSYDDPDDAEPPEESADAAAVHIVSGLEDEVLVIDERPRYHLAGCRAVLAEPVIPLPAREAVDLGFTPCGWCSPDTTLAGRHRADVGH